MKKVYVVQTVWYSVQEVLCVYADEERAKRHARRVSKKTHVDVRVVPMELR